MLQLSVTYMVRHNLYIDAMYVYRNADAFSKKYSADLDYLSIGVRLNIGLKRFEF